jgi:hypothetical protein
MSNLFGEKIEIDYAKSDWKSKLFYFLTDLYEQKHFEHQYMV